MQFLLPRADKTLQTGHFAFHRNRMSWVLPEVFTVEHSSMKGECKTLGFSATRTAVFTTRKGSERQVIYKSSRVAANSVATKKTKAADGGRPTENGSPHILDAIGSSSKWQMSGASFGIKESLVPSLPNLPVQSINI